MTDVFAPRGPGDVLDLIAEFPLAWLIAPGAEGSPSVLLPLLADQDEEGGLTALLGHLPRAHALMDSWATDPRALVLIQGPQGYLSPSWLSDRAWAPTWAYAAIHIEGRVRFAPERTHEALERLVAAMEHGRPRSWSLPELGERYARLARGVIAFCVEELSVTARFRFGQDERLEVWQELVARNPDQAISLWMERFGKPSR